MGGNVARLGAADAVQCAPMRPSSRDAVLLLHGLASNASRWSEFIESTTLGRHWTVLAPDLRGHGTRRDAGPAGIAQWSADLDAALDAAGAPRALLIGHSLGAQLALHHAASRPDRALGLVLIDPVFRAALGGRWALLARLSPLLRLAVGLVRGLNRMGLRRREVVPDDLRALDALAREALRDPATEVAFVRRYSSTAHDLRQIRTAQYLQDLVEMFRPAPSLEKLAMPVLTLLSTGATFADPARTRALLDRLPDGELVTIDCHHWPLTERPADVRVAIEAWVARRFPRP
jgi:pimeloyl-ACP methyl ester carboxylesterase